MSVKICEKGKDKLNICGPESMKTHSIVNPRSEEKFFFSFLKTNIQNFNVSRNAQIISK